MKVLCINVIQVIYLLDSKNICKIPFSRVAHIFIWKLLEQQIMKNLKKNKEFNKICI